MRYKKGQRFFIDLYGKVIVQIISTSRRTGCFDTECTVCRKQTYYTIKCIQNKNKKKDIYGWPVGRTIETLSNSMNVWTYLEGQDAPKN